MRLLLILFLMCANPTFTVAQDATKDISSKRTIQAGFYAVPLEMGYIANKEACPGYESRHNDPDYEVSWDEGYRCEIPYRTWNWLSLNFSQNGDLNFEVNLEFFNGHGCRASGCMGVVYIGWNKQWTRIRTK